MTSTGARILYFLPFLAGINNCVCSKKVEVCERRLSALEDQRYTLTERAWHEQRTQSEGMASRLGKARESSTAIGECEETLDTIAASYQVCQNDYQHCAAQFETQCGPYREAADRSCQEQITARTAHWAAEADALRLTCVSAEKVGDLQNRFESLRRDCEWTEGW